MKLFHLENCLKSPLKFEIGNSEFRIVFEVLFLLFLIFYKTWFKIVCFEFWPIFYIFDLVKVSLHVSMVFRVSVTLDEFLQVQKQLLYSHPFHQNIFIAWTTKLPQKASKWRWRKSWQLTHNPVTINLNFSNGHWN